MRLSQIGIAIPVGHLNALAQISEATKTQEMLRADETFPDLEDSVFPSKKKENEC